MKRILLLLSVCISPLITSGCWDRVEVNDLAIVTAAAIDKNDDNQIELSIQVYIPKSTSRGSSQGGGGGKSGESTTLVKSHQGSNISDALSKLQSKFPRKIFWGQCKVFIIGEELAEEGIQDHLDFLLRHPQPRERAYVYVSQGEAKKMIETQPRLESYSGEVIRELSDLKIGMQITIQNLDEMLTSPSRAAALPYLKMLPPESGEKKIEESPYIFGTAVFREDKMIGKVSEKDTRGLIWLRNEMEAYTITVEPAGTEGKVSLNPVSDKVILIPEILNDEWIMHVKIKTEGTIIQNGTKWDLSKPELLEAVETAFQDVIKDRIEKAFQLSQHKLKADIVGFGKEFYRKYPKQFNKNDWDQVFPEVEVIISVKAHIRRQGYINKPGGLTEEEEEAEE